MRKYVVPMAVLGLGSVGAFLFTERGRNLLAQGIDRLRDAPETLAEWNDAAQRELELVRLAVDELSRTISVPR